MTETARHILADELQQCWQNFCAHNSEESFAAIYEKSRGYIFTICMAKLGREEEATEAMQEVYSHLLELVLTQADCASTDINLLVRTLAIRQADTMAKRMGRESARTTTVDESFDITAETESPRHEASRKQLRALVREELMELPEKVRVPLVMHHEEGMTHQEIADSLSVSRSYVTKRIQEGYESLEISLRRRGVVDPALAVATMLVAHEILQPPASATAAAIYQAARAKVLSKATVATAAPASAAVKVTGGAKTPLSSAKAWFGSSPVQAAAAVLVVTIAALMIWTNPFQERPPRATSVPSAANQHGRAAALAGAGAPTVIGATEPTGGAGAGDSLVGTGGAISGRVVSRYDGSPLGGFAVNLPDFQTSATALERLLASSTTTDANGFFSFPSVPEGTYRVSVQGRGGWRDEHTTAAVLAQLPANIGEIALNRFGSVLGRLVNSDTDQPVADEEIALVSNVKDFKKVARTDADGIFRFDGLDLPHYGLLAHSGTSFHAVHIPEGGVREITWQIGSGSIRGKVHYEHLGAENVNVRAVRVVDREHRGVVASIDSEGVYELKGLPGGLWTLEAIPARPALHAQRARHNVKLTEGVTAVQDLHLPSGRVLGTVLTNEGTPAGNVQIRAISHEKAMLADVVKSDSYAATSKDDGSFVLEGCTPGTYTLVAVLPDSIIAYTREVEVPERGETGPVVVVPAGEHATGGLDVTLLSVADANPVETGWIELSGPAGRLLLPTDGKSGAVRVSGLPAGTYSYRTSGFGFSIASGEAELRDGRPLEITQALDPAGAFEWNLSEIRDQTSEELICKLTPLDPNSREVVRTGKPDADGQWRLRGILPGQYLASVEFGTQEISTHIRIDPGGLTNEATHADNRILSSGR